ncbi:MAG: transposase [Bacillota bacterium]|nr:transposase [Bacillota bacterium]
MELAKVTLESKRTIAGTANQLAVPAMVRLPYNNGLAEGSVNKIKVIKRIMYGCNSFELLKAKVLFGELFHVKFN